MQNTYSFHFELRSVLSPRLPLYDDANKFRSRIAGNRISALLNHGYLPAALFLHLLYKQILHLRGGSSQDMPWGLWDHLLIDVVHGGKDGGFLASALLYHLAFAVYQ